MAPLTVGRHHADRPPTLAAHTARISREIREVFRPASSGRSQSKLRAWALAAVQDPPFRADFNHVSASLTNVPSVSVLPFDAAATGRLERVQFALTESGVGSTNGLWFVLSTFYRHLPERLSHAQRVTKMAKAIAVQMGRTTAEVDQIERAALAHEVGTIIVPDPAIGRSLAEGEMRAKASEQAIAGARALATVAFLEPAARLVRAMPEWIDGTGSPSGLSGSEIPMGARIVAVADVFDVMDTTCQQLGWPRDLAAVELVRYAGRRFDADVVAAALRVVESVPADASSSMTGAAQVV